MFKVAGSLELSIDDIKRCIEGSQKLSACINYDRAKEGKSFVYVDEAYFVRYAISTTLNSLDDSCKKFEEN